MTLYKHVIELYLLEQHSKSIKIRSAMISLGLTLEL